MGSFLEDLISKVSGTSNDPVPAATPNRAIGASFQPSLTGWVWCSYVVEQSATTTQNGTVTLSIGAADPPATAVASAKLSNQNAATAVTRTQLHALVPPGNFVKLVAAGTGANTIVEQYEAVVS